MIEVFKSMLSFVRLWGGVLTLFQLETLSWAG